MNETVLPLATAVGLLAKIVFDLVRDQRRNGNGGMLRQLATMAKQIETVIPHVTTNTQQLKTIEHEIETLRQRQHDMSNHLNRLGIEIEWLKDVLRRLGHSTP